MARFVLLGRLEDLVDSPELEVDGVPHLAAALFALPPLLRDEAARGKVRFAVNGEVVPAGADLATIPLDDTDEVALLPPVSGG